MSTIQGNLINHNGDKVVPNTLTSAVYDAAKEQALSATLASTLDKSSLGYSTFTTVLAYDEGDIVYYNTKLYQFTSAHAAGAWIGSDATEIGIDDLKADKITSATSGDVVTFDSTGNIQDSTIASANLVLADADAVEGNIAVYDSNKKPADGNIASADLVVADNNAVEGNVATYGSDGKPTDSNIASADLVVADDNAVEGNLAEYDSNGKPTDSGIATDDVALQDGYYSSMAVGVADNLAGRGTVSAKYTFRTSGGSEDIGTGTATIDTYKGNTIVWNQLLDSDDYVDMGLPSGTLWATKNIDVTQPNGFAASPYQYEGTFFSWGNVEGHNPSSTSAFTYDWGSINAEDPYYENQPYGETTGAALTESITAGDTYDAARKNIGAIWRMPTSTEFAELFSNIIYIDATGTEIPSETTNKLVTVNGVVGIYLQSTINGNRLFFSCSGSGNGTSWNSSGSVGYYWSASNYSARNARYYYFNSSGVGPSDYGRYSGFAVRPVLKPSATAEIGHDNHKFVCYGENMSDLTLMFGSGSEPTSAAEMSALYPLNYDYNAGELVNNTASAIKTVGFNQWDEEWRHGVYDVSTGAYIGNATNVCNVNPIPIFPNTDYYCKLTGQVVFGFYYDAEMNYLPSGVRIENQVFHTPVNARYMNFYVYNPAYTYNHDICINLSWSGYRNGEYEAYEEHTTYINGSSGSLATLTGKLNGAGESVTVFADGLRSVDSKYDYVKGNIGMVAIGSQSVTGAIGDTITLEGCDTTATTYKAVADIGTLSAGVLTLTAAATDVEVLYALATPQSYTLDTAPAYQYPVNDFGTEQSLPASTASAVVAPILYDVKYALNAVDVVRRLNINYISKESFENFCTELATKLGTALNSTITITPTYDSTDEEYDYSISIVANE